MEGCQRLQVWIGGACQLGVGEEGSITFPSEMDRAVVKSTHMQLVGGWPLC